jgi:hypothetical protein
VTSFLGTTSGSDGGVISLAQDDKRLVTSQYNWLDTIFWVKIKEAFDIGELRGYADEFWPGLGGLDASGNEWLIDNWDAGVDLFGGTNARYAFIGVTRDGYGTAIGGMTVKLFKTVGGGNPDLKDVKIDETVSDVSGNFQVTTPYYPDTHYIVSYKAGTPDIQGITTNTLIGA